MQTHRRRNAMDLWEQMLYLCGPKEETQKKKTLKCEMQIQNISNTNSRMPKTDNGSNGKT